jgi:Dolichyl-phosphate-mannose-protein mannosyltransferase
MAAPGRIIPFRIPLTGKQGAARPEHKLVAVIIRYGAIGLLALAIVRLWILPLGTSLWLDETGTFWLIKDGPRAMLSRISDWPSSSVAYGYIAWVAYALGGAREWVLRLPSVFAVAVAAVFVYQIARRLLDVESAFPAVAVFVCLKWVAFSAGEACYAVSGS